MTPAWTATPPTKPGWYWYWAPERPISIIQIVRVYETINGVMMVQWLGNDSEDELRDWPGARWSARIEEPKL